jgi:DNA-directed RNA polymerase, mitochondrial
MKDLYTIQEAIEKKSRATTINKFNSELAKKQNKHEETATYYGSPLFKRAIEPVALLVEHKVAEAKKGRAGNANIAVKYLSLLKPEHVAYHTAKVIIDRLMFSKSIQDTAIAIASSLEDELRYISFDNQHPHLFKKIVNETATNGQRRRQTILAAYNRYCETWVSWSKNDKVHLGMALISLFIEATDFVSEHYLNRGKNKTDIVLRPTQKVLDFIEKNRDFASLVNPEYLPMVVPPRDWTSPTDGGYLTPYAPQMPLIKVRNSPKSRNYFEDLSSLTDSMEAVYHSVNILQRTAWRINPFVLDVFKKIHGLGLPVATLPSVEDIPPIPSPLEKSQKTNELTEQQKEKFKAWKRKEVERHDANFAMQSKRLMVGTIARIANDYVKYEAIYFPHSMDFRGRLYPAPMFLNPQGNKLAKGLLEFAEGKAIGSNEAAFELAVHGANCFGYDKGTMDERIDWVEENTDRILQVASDPMADLWWAKEADSPWCFLAFAKEWEGFQRDGYSHVSHIPIAKDGSCSGLQHFSAALRDPVGATATNLLPSEQPEDIYQRVIDATKDKVLADLNGDKAQLAQACLDYGLSRKAAKRSTMTRVYGSTLYSSRTFVAEYFKETDEQRKQENPHYVSSLHGIEFQASLYLAKHIWDSINETVIAAKEGMDWLQTCARLLADDGSPTSWTTLDGFPVLQYYPNTTRNRIKTKLGDKKVYVSLRKELAGIDKKKQSNSISPNWVHANDACHLRMTVNLAAANGVSSFAMIHDSFGSHAADIPMLSACLRETFIELYLDNDPLEMFLNQTQILTNAELPELPAKGTLDISSVRNSEFFFA